MILRLLIIVASIFATNIYPWAFRWCGPQGSGLYYAYYDHTGTLHCNDPKDPRCILSCQQNGIVPCDALKPGGREYRLDSDNATGPHVITLQNIDKSISDKFVINAHDDVYITPCANPAEGFAFYKGHKPECNADRDNCASSCFSNAKKEPYGNYQYCKTKE